MGQNHSAPSAWGLQQTPQGGNSNNNNPSTTQNSHPQPSTIPPLNSQQALQKASILDCIPQDIWKNHIIPYLDSNSYVRVITGKPSQEQKAKIITKIASDKIKESNFFTRLFQSVPFVVHGYLLIKYPRNTNNNNSKTTYALGYYDQQDQYCESPVHDKSSLHNYLGNNPAILNNSATNFVSDDPDLLRWVSRAVKDNGGQLACANSDVLNLSLTNKANLKFFEPNRKWEYFQILLDAVVRSEYDRAERVLKSHPELLLSEYEGSITDTGIADRTFLKATAFQLAVWNGDWQMYNMMLDSIPEDKKTTYKMDLKNQRKELNEKGLTYTLNNLKACGLRILDGEPSEKIKQDVIKRNAYLFIIDKNSHTCSLGFKDPNTKKYTQYVLDPDSDLSKQADTLQQALNNHRNIDKLPHCIIRDEVILALARKEIEQYGGHTEITETSSSHELKPLLNALQEYNDQYAKWTDPQKTEHWCIIIGWAQRLLPAAVWNWWLHPDINWWNTSEKDFNRNFPPSFRPKFSDNSHLVALTSSLGDKFVAAATRNGLWQGAFAGVAVVGLNYLSQARTQKLNLLCKILTITPPINNHRIV